MICNIGKTDQTIRFIVGGVIVVAGYYYQSWWGAVGYIPLATATLRWCPPYQLLGITTHKK